MTPKMTRWTLALVAGLMLTGLAQAQTKKELIAKVIQLQQPSVENVARSIAAQTAQQILEATGPAVAQQPADKREAVAKDVQAEVKKFYGDIESVLRDRAVKLAPTAMAPVLEEKFSEDELKQLVAWLESPTAKKFNESAPVLLETMQQKLVADTRGTVEPKIRTLEGTLRKKLGLPAAAPASPAASAAKPAKK
ncbi:DUF2059 domain-containing protein [Ideonella dechloratans]|uniref:DUF2059 domain-containing protein n=1 Tax=Ideonella dechloratans TaxID=36863 RepID=A0A643FEB1_IDEDE|nr:DUF2059 domain-containing protein [Ideonella dechloratans]KAB0583538.1 DUF2059 domain-containing protein [Ideonella dechloratans]UFU09048.1 DUF2059 domain-containing protein [Ideonella dechloratans]